MLSHGIIQAAYVIAALLFIFSLRGLSNQESAKSGNIYGMIGMAIALIAAVASIKGGLHWIIIAMVIGAAIGLYLAKKVEMTQMPELVALLHSFVGMPAVLVGINSFLDPHMVAPNEVTIHLVEIFVGVFIGDRKSVV